MTPLSQFSAGIPQSQFDFFSAVTAKAFASAERVIALNLTTSRATVERSSNAFKQLLQLNDPRDLLSLTSQPQQELQSLLAYSRELLSIVADVGLKLPTASAAAFPLPTPAAAPLAAAPAPAPVARAAAVQPAPQPVQAPSVAADAVAEPQANAVDKAPVVAAVAAPVAEAAAEPVAEAKPVAKALSKVAPKPAEHPLAAPVATQHEIELPQVKPVEAAPPPAPVSGTPVIDARQAEAARSRNARKK